MHKRERRGLSWAIWRERGAGNSTCKGPGEDCALLTQELKQEDPASWGQGGEDQVGSKTHVLFLLSTKGIGGGTRTLVTLASHWFSQEFSSLTYKTGRCFLTSPCEAAEAMGRRHKDGALHVGGLCFPWALPCCHSLPSPRYLFQLLPLHFPPPLRPCSPHPPPAGLRTNRAGD